MLCDQIMVQFILGKKNMSGYPDRLRSLDIFFQIVYKQAFLRLEYGWFPLLFTQVRTSVISIHSPSPS